MSHFARPHLDRRLPDIVSIVLRQAFRLFSTGDLPRATYRRQLERLEREELQPRGLALEVDDEEPGRFVIRNRKTHATEMVCVSAPAEWEPELVEA